MVGELPKYQPCGTLKHSCKGSDSNRQIRAASSNIQSTRTTTLARFSIAERSDPLARRGRNAQENFPNSSWASPRVASGVKIADFWDLFTQPRPYPLTWLCLHKPSMHFEMTPFPIIALSRIRVEHNRIRCLGPRLDCRVSAVLYPIEKSQTLPSTSRPRPLRSPP
jgi:hypothetical protein